jgi:hypothetical protein
MDISPIHVNPFISSHLFFAGASASLDRTGWRCGEEIAEQGLAACYEK